MDIANYNAMCEFSPRMTQAVPLTSFLGCHAADILCKGTDDELVATAKVLRSSQAEEIEKFPPQTHIIFTGIMIGRPDARSWNIHLSQSHYANALQKVDVAQFAQRGKILDTQKDARQSDKYRAR